MSATNHYHFQVMKRENKLLLKIVNIVNKILVAISVYLIFGLLFQYVYADTSTDPYQTQHGSVWLLPDNGVYLEAMQMHTDVHYDVTGAIARARVKQQFKNDSEFWAEGIYVFPLPEKAAVDQFKMIIGDRIVEGQIKERVIAKKIYEKAKSAGKKASLIEQQRPNVFTTALANIAPGETITVEFEYQQTLDYKDNSYRLRYPMVVGPRYHAGNPSADSLLHPAPNQTSVFTETSSSKHTTNPTRIHIMLDSGVSLAELKSSYHKIDIKQTSENRFSIATIGENIIANRDFELVWKPELNDKPQLSAFSEQIGEEHYTMVSLLPPDLTYLEQKVQAREVVFVLDISGSMSGTSIEQAKASLLTALGNLTSIDQFNIIWFNDQTGSLFPKATHATAQYKNYAKQFIKKLSAGGGTEMLPALKRALSDQKEFSRFRQVVFLTDGNINNESALFNIIDKQLGNSRLFTIGIGSAPNSYFMRKAANKGRGTFTYIGDVNEVEEKTVAIFKKLERPALINIELIVDSHNSGSDTTDHDNYEIFPKIIPDLYANEPLTLLFKGDEIPKDITLKGDYGNTEWQTNAILKTTSKSGIRVAWAREKISSLMNQHRESKHETEKSTIQQEVTDTALQHHLVSRFTSLVAVDVTPVNDSGMLYSERMKNNLPHGWKKPSQGTLQNRNMTLATIRLPQTASSSKLNLLLAILLFLSAGLVYRWKQSGALRNV